MVIIQNRLWITIHMRPQKSQHNFEINCNDPVDRVFNLCGAQTTDNNVVKNDLGFNNHTNSIFHSMTASQVSKISFFFLLLLTLF